MITDTDIIKIFTKDNKIIPAHIKESFIQKQREEILNYLKYRYIDIPDDIFTYKEVIWRILKNIENRPTCSCELCKNNVKFIGKLSWDLSGRTINGYNKYCSDKCANNDINKQNKAKNTFLKKYGVDNPLKSKIIKQKMINTRLNTPNFWENIVIKRQQTCLKKYGVISYTQTNEFIIKFKETCLKKYGFDNPTKTESVKQKIKNTCLEKYNCINGGMSSKAIKTFKQHKSFNSSKAEKQLYDMIKNIYENTKYQYTSESYPYMCDYFIPELNLYIEYQGSMFHNMHLYKNNDEDNIQLNKFKIKAQTHLRYKSLIEQWTIRDVKKYNIACNNKLNYLLIYPKWHKNWYSYLYNKNKEKYIESLNNSLCTILNKFKNKSNTQIIIGES